MLIVNVDNNGNVTDITDALSVEYAPERNGTIQWIVPDNNESTLRSLMSQPNHGGLHLDINTGIFSLIANTTTISNPIKDNIVNLAQSSVGIALNQLTANQVRALLACLLYKAGGVKPDMTVDSLGNWLQ